jgi:hypothetical protein
MIYSAWASVPPACGERSSKREVKSTKTFSLELGSFPSQVDFRACASACFEGMLIKAMPFFSTPPFFRSISSQIFQILQPCILHSA